MLKFGEACVFNGSDANRLSLRHVRPGAFVSPFESRVKPLEAFPVRAPGEWIGAGLDRAQLEAAHALQGIERPTGGFSELAVIDDVDSRLRLALHDFGDRVLEALLVGSRVDGLAVLLRACQFEKPWR